MAVHLSSPCFVHRLSARARLPLRPGDPSAGRVAAGRVAAGPIGVASRFVVRRFFRRPARPTWPPRLPSPGEPQIPPGVRNGVFQKILFDGTWLAPGGADGMGMYDSAIADDLRDALPDDRFAAGDHARLCRALPARAGRTPICRRGCYEGYIEFRWLSQVTPKLGLDLAITPGVYSDFDQESSKAFRLPGHGAAAWTWNETGEDRAGGGLSRPAGRGDDSHRRRDLDAERRT